MGNTFRGDYCLKTRGDTFLTVANEKKTDNADVKPQTQFRVTHYSLPNGLKSCRKESLLPYGESSDPR